ncbi:hypothetical protein LAZ67_3002886 [Cordylochernes scorpioides]|uniref:Uncharacterized protein n=1 Tax=Cordylochernes scorpioides TaxID=51811 RepID=A0ABY6K877_9ARAC|nr:hypothetical protein LAZ67_3002886 [Cordylochernes scorpioides]
MGLLFKYRLKDSPLRPRQEASSNTGRIVVVLDSLFNKRILYSITLGFSFRILYSVALRLIFRILYSVALRLIFRILYSVALRLIFRIPYSVALISCFLTFRFFYLISFISVFRIHFIRFCLRFICFVFSLSFLHTYIAINCSFRILHFIAFNCRFCFLPFTAFNCRFCFLPFTAFNCRIIKNYNQRTTIKGSILMSDWQEFFRNLVFSPPIMNVNLNSTSDNFDLDLES